MLHILYVQIVLFLFKVIRVFYVRVLWERAGIIPQDWDGSDDNATLPLNASDGSNSSMSLYQKLLYAAENSDQVEILWSITVAVFVLFGMVGSFLSGKLAEKMGR